MITDGYNLFGSAIAIPDTAAATIVGDVIDTGGDGLNEPDLWLAIQMVVANAGGTTVEFELLSDSTADLATSPTVHFSSGAIAVAGLTLGSVPVQVKLPNGTYERYVGIRVTRVGNGTAGTFEAALAEDVPTWKAFPEGQN